MKKWNDKHAHISRWSLSVRKEEDLVLRYEELRDGSQHFTVETFIGGGTESKVLEATTVEDAKVEAEAWYKAVLEHKIALLEETICGYRETIKSLEVKTV
jgi:hypothetical protein